MWINNPELTSEQKHKMYIDSMEKAMDAGEKIALELLEIYRENLAQKYIASGSEEKKADILFDAIAESYVVFNEMMPGEAKDATEKFIYQVQWGEE